MKFPGVDPLLGPEMKSTGEVMGVGRSFGEAFGKAQLGAGVVLPTSGRVFISVRERDREAVIEVARMLIDLGFEIISTRGTAAVLREHGVECTQVKKVYEGRPHVVDMIKNEEIDLISNTTEGKQAIADSFTIRAAALQNKVSYTTTLAGARATCMALQCKADIEVNRLQDLHQEIAK